MLLLLCVWVVILCVFVSMFCLLFQVDLLYMQSLRGIRDIHESGVDEHSFSEVG